MQKIAQVLFHFLVFGGLAWGTTSLALPRHKTLVLGIDGARADVLEHVVWKLNKAPAIRSLMQRGKYAPCPDVRSPLCARAHSGPKILKNGTWVTAPGWLSVITGVDNTKHLVTGNGFEEQQIFATTSKNYPSFFKRLKDVGLATAAGGVSNFMSSRPFYFFGEDYGIVDFECGTNNSKLNISIDATSSCNLTERKPFGTKSGSRDTDLTKWLLKTVRDGKASVVMGVYDEVDSAGHASGFEFEKKYMEAMSKADSRIQKVLGEVEKVSREKSEAWVVLITSDHGGHPDDDKRKSGGHNTVLDLDDAVPFVVAVYGEDVKMKDLEYPIRHMDVFSTVMHWHGQDAGNVDGKVQGII